MKANLKTGLLIEPHYLERTKFARELPVIDDDQTMVNGSYNTINSEIEPNRSFSLTGSSVITTNNRTLVNKLTEIPYPLFSDNLSTTTNINGGSALSNLVDGDISTAALFRNDGTDFQIIYDLQGTVRLSKVQILQTNAAYEAHTIMVSTSTNGGETFTGAFNLSENLEASDNYITLFTGNQFATHLQLSITEQQNSTFVNFSELKVSIFKSSQEETKEQGTNCTIDIDDYILDESQESAQAPIKPFDPNTGKPAGYIARKSSTLLGNVVKGRISSRYYRKLSNGKETEY